MQLAFITDIHITNATDQPLRVTPVGAVGPQGHRVPLPIFRQLSPAFESPQRGGFVVQPGSTVELLYDWDDVNLAEIVAENTEGDVRQLVADPNPAINQYRMPTPNAFTISEFQSLSPVPRGTMLAYQEAQSSSAMWPRLLLVLLPWVSFTGLLVIAGRRRRDHHRLHLTGLLRA